MNIYLIQYRDYFWSGHLSSKIIGAKTLQQALEKMKGVMWKNGRNRNYVVESVSKTATIDAVAV